MGGDGCTRKPPSGMRAPKRERAASVKAAVSVRRSIVHGARSRRRKMAAVPAANARGAQRAAE